jgi:hypothetical protein
MSQPPLQIINLDRQIYAGAPYEQNVHIRIFLECVINNALFNIKLVSMDHFIVGDFSSN